MRYLTTAGDAGRTSSRCPPFHFRWVPPFISTIINYIPLNILYILYSSITVGHVLHDRRRRAGLADNIFLGLFAVHEVDARLSHLWLDADYFRCAYTSSSCSSQIAVIGGSLCMSSYRSSTSLHFGHVSSCNLLAKFHTISFFLWIVTSLASIGICHVFSFNLTCVFNLDSPLHGGSLRRVSIWLELWWLSKDLWTGSESIRVGALRHSLGISAGHHWLCWWRRPCHIGLHSGYAARASPAGPNIPELSVQR